MPRIVGKPTSSGKGTSRAARAGSRGDIRCVHDFRTRCRRGSANRGQDEPRGAPGRRPRRLLRDVARGRAGARGDAGRAARRALHDHHGRGGRTRPPDRRTRRSRRGRRAGSGSGRIREGGRGRRRGLPVLDSDQGKRNRERRREIWRRTDGDGSHGRGDVARLTDGRGRDDRPASGAGRSGRST